MHKFPLFFLAFLIVAPANAADAKFDADACAVTIAPYLDEQTVAVARIDLTRIDFDKITVRLIELGKLEARDKDALTTGLRSWLPDLLKTGAKEMYIVFTLDDLPAVPFVVVPLEGKVEDKAVSAALRESKLFDKVEQMGRCVFAAGEKTLLRLREHKPAQRPELARAFAAAGDSTVQLLVLPTADLKRAFDETMPRLPKEIGGGPIKPFTRGLSWAAVGVDLGPKLSARITVQAPDAPSALALSESVVAVLKAVKDHKELRDLFPNFDQLIPQFTPQVEGDRLTLSLDEKNAAAILQPLLAKARSNVRQTGSVNTLKMIGLAMHNYHDTFRALPTVGNFEKQGKQPLLSWRVHLLPYLEQDNLYRQFRLNEPWDSPHNKKLIASMPAIYNGPNAKLNAEGRTPFLVPVGPNMIFTGGPKGIRMLDIFDGTSNTIMAFEADDAHAVVWTKPDDIKIDPKEPQTGLADNKGVGYTVLFGDGSVTVLPTTIDKKTLYALFTRNGGEVVKLP